MTYFSYKKNTKAISPKLMVRGGADLCLGSGHRSSHYWLNLEWVPYPLVPGVLLGEAVLCGPSWTLSPFCCRRRCSEIQRLKWASHLSLTILATVLHFESRWRGKTWQWFQWVKSTAKGWMHCWWTQSLAILVLGWCYVELYKPGRAILNNLLLTMLFHTCYLRCW